MSIVNQDIATLALFYDTYNCLPAESDDDKLQGRRLCLSAALSNWVWDSEMVDWDDVDVVNLVADNISASCTSAVDIWSIDIDKLSVVALRPANSGSDENDRTIS